MWNRDYPHDENLYNWAFNAIQEERRWRLQELMYFREQMLRAKKKNTGDKNNDVEYSIKSGIVMLYSHIEGYIKKISEIYLEYINRLEINFLLLNPGLRAGLISLARLKIRKSNVEYTSKKNDSHRVLYNTYKEYFSSSSIIDIFTGNKNKEKRPVDFLLDVDSNLDDEKFKNILRLLDIDTFKYQNDFKNFKTIVVARNSIAHGEKEIFINYDKCIQLYKWFIGDIMIKYPDDIDRLINGNSRFHASVELSDLFCIHSISKKNQNDIGANLEYTFSSINWQGLFLTSSNNNTAINPRLYFGYYTGYSETDKNKSTIRRKFNNIEEDSLIFILRTENLAKLYHMGSSCLLPMCGDYIISSLQKLDVSISKDHIRDEYVIVVNIDSQLVKKINLIRDILDTIEFSNRYI